MQNYLPTGTSLTRSEVIFTSHFFFLILFAYYTRDMCIDKVVVDVLVNARRLHEQCRPMGAGKRENSK